MADRTKALEAERRYRERHPERRRESNLRARKRYEARYPERTSAAKRQYEARQRGLFMEPVSPLVVLEEHDGVCGICGKDVDPFDFHVDHRIPMSRGGEHGYLNCQPAHPVCNWEKKDRVI